MRAGRARGGCRAGFLPVWCSEGACPTMGRPRASGGTADALSSGGSVLMGVGVQIPPCALNEKDPDTLFRRGLSRSSGMWIWEPPQRSEDGGVPPCAREDEGPRTSRFGALRAFVGGPSSCLGEQSPVSHHLKILIEDCLLTQGRRANWDWSARDEPRPAVGAALWPALGGGSPLPPRESPSTGRTSNASEMMMVCQPTRLRWSGRSRLATATGSP